MRALAAGLAAAALVVPGAEAAERSVEDLVRARCATCHGRSVAGLAQRCAQLRGVEGLDAFLARHHARDPVERAAIVAHLRACEAAEPPATR